MSRQRALRCHLLPRPWPQLKPFRTHRSRASRYLHGAGLAAGPQLEVGLLYCLQVPAAYLQFIGEQHAATGQHQVIYFKTDDLATKGWKAIPSALDHHWPTGIFSGRKHDPWC